MGSLKRKKTKRVLARISSIIAIIIMVLSAMLLVPVVAWDEYHGNPKPISQDEDSYWNYDFVDDHYDPDDVDWSVTIIFWYDASVEEVYRVY